MIIVKITSGLGNQMFQYSFVKLLCSLYPDAQIKIDTTWFYANDEHQGFELERIFGENENYRSRLMKFWDYVLVRGRIPSFVKGRYAKLAEDLLYYPNRLLRVFTEKKCNRTYINQLAFEEETDVYYMLTHLDTKRNWYIEGFWIEEQYYRGRLGELYRLFQFDERRISSVNKQLLREIQSCQSVSIHVRHGDYMSKYAKSFHVLSMDYYKKCIAYISRYVEQPHFYIFSDDKAYIENQFGWLQNKTIVSQNDGKGSYVDMQLMSACKHNIIANSTFSTWGALLNQNKERIVLYPKQYMHSKDNEMKTISGWHMIDAATVHQA